MEPQEIKKLIVEILNEKKKARQDMLLGFHRSKFSEAQIEFINKKLGLNDEPKLTIDMVQEFMGGKIIK